MVKFIFIILFLTNSLCVWSTAIFADRHHVVFAEDNKVKKTFDDVDDNKAFFEQCENIAQIFASHEISIAVANVVNKESQDRVLLNEKGKCVTTYNYLGEVLPLKNWTNEHIEKVLELMAKMHTLDIQYPNYIEKKDDEITQKSKNFSWKDSFYSDNKFIKKNIHDTFFIERIQAQVKEDESKLELVTSSFKNNTQSINEAFWQDIAGAEIDRNDIERYVNDFVSWLPKADEGHENQLSVPQEVLSLRNFEPQNIVWDENSNPWIIGTSHFGYVDPKKEVINFAAVMSGFFHDQKNINWERFFYILTKYSELNPKINVTKADAHYQLQNYLFNTKNVKYTFVKLNLELAKPAAEQDLNKLKQYAVIIQIGLRSLNDSWNNFGDIYLALFP